MSLKIIESTSYEPLISPQAKKSNWSLKGGMNSEKIWIVTTGILGALSTYVYYPLGVGFARHFCSWVDITNKESRKTFEVIVGINSMLAMLALATLSAFDTGKKIRETLSCTTQKKILAKKNKIEKMITVSSFILGLFFSIPRTYLSIKYTRKWFFVWRIFMILPSFLVPFAIGTVKAESLFAKIFHKFKKNEYLSQIHLLIKYIEDSSESLELNLSSNSRLDEVIQEVNRLNLKEREKTSNYQKTAFSYLGFLIGALSNYAYLSITLEGTKFFCQTVDIPLSVARVLSYFALSLYLFPSIALRGLSTKNRFEKLYSLLSCKQGETILFKKRGREVCIKILSLVEGLFAALPATYLAIASSTGNPWYAKIFLVVPSFLAPFSMSSHHIEELFQRLHRKHSTASHAAITEHLKSLRNSISLMTNSEVKMIMTNQIN